MGELPNQRVRSIERPESGERKKPVQERENHAPRLLATEVVRGKQRDQNRHANRWDPVFETRNHIECLGLRSDCKGAHLVQ